MKSENIYGLMISTQVRNQGMGSNPALSTIFSIFIPPRQIRVLIFVIIIALCSSLSYTIWDNWVTEGIKRFIDHDVGDNSNIITGRGTLSKDSLC